LKITTEFESDIDQDNFNADIRNPMNEDIAKMDLVDELGRAGFHILDNGAKLALDIFSECDVITDLECDETDKSFWDHSKEEWFLHSWIDVNYAIRDWIETLGKMGEVTIKARKNA
jgi:hypothetical protein